MGDAQQRAGHEGFPKAFHLNAIQHIEIQIITMSTLNLKMLLLMIALYGLENMICLWLFV